MIDKISTTLKALQKFGRVSEAYDNPHTNVLLVLKYNYEFFKEQPGFKVEGSGNSQCCDLAISIVGPIDLAAVQKKAQEFDLVHFE